MDSMDTFADVARIFSGVFLVIQIFVLIIWADETSDDVYNRMNGVGYEEADPNVGMCMIFWSFACVVGSWILDGFFFPWYAPDDVKDSCGLNVFLIVLTIVLTLVNTVFAMTEWAPNGRMFTATVVQFYATFLLYTALASDKTTCNTYLEESGQKGGANMWIGLVFITAALSYLGYKTTTVFLAEDEKEELQATDEKLKLNGEGDEESGAADKNEDMNT